MMLKYPKNDKMGYHTRPNPLKWGEHEFNIARLHIRNFRTCLDIGAHIGVTTMRYSTVFQQVHSFEPMVYSYLEENTKHLTNVERHHCAVSDKNGRIVMYPNPLNSTGGIIPADYNTSTIERRYTGDAPQMENVEPFDVDCCTIDSFQFDDVDFVKIDVEGHIVPVMNGMIETLKKSHPVIQMELSFDAQNKQVDALLKSLGYAMFNSYKRDIFYRRVQ